MTTYTDTDLRTMIDKVQAPVLADELNEAIGALKEADSRIQSAAYRLGLLVSGPPPLPAPALTEDAIVAALKADPAMAGRVMVCVADTMWAEDRLTVSTAAKQACNSPTVSRGASGALQSLAVALAAASYRG